MGGEPVVEKEVIVAFGPESVDLEDGVASPLELNEGDKMQFGCVANKVNPPVDAVVYKIGDKVVKPNETALAEFDGKKLVCSATNKLTGEEKSAEIDVAVKHAPVVKNKAAVELEVPLEEQVNLICAESGNPEPTYSWTFEPTAEEGSIEGDATAKTLTFTASETTMGTYKCTATN